MIKRYSYTGSSTPEALAKAKAELGDDFAIETTKQIRAKTLNQTPLFEVVVCVEVKDDNEMKNTQKEAQVNDIKRQIEAYTNMGKAARANSFAAGLGNSSLSNSSLGDLGNSSLSNSSLGDKNESEDEDVSMSISKAASEIQSLAQIPAQAPIIDYSAKMRDIERKVDKLSDRLTLIADAVWEDKAKSRGDIAIPPEFATIYKKAASSGMKDEHVKAIMEATITHMPSSMKNNPSAIERYFYFLLEKMLPSKKNEISNKRQKIIMLIGPTGVGKTTTLSKLAYKYAHDSGAHYKTGIITLDSYRIGAVEQLAQYSQIMKMRMIEAINVEEFKEALRGFSGYDVVLVDTLGSSQYDTEKLNKLSEFIKGVDADIEVNLVLSANTKFDDLMEIYENFSFVDISSLIITKLDETRIFGNIFSLIYETSVPVSYFSTGQNVPDDIVEASSAFLVKCVLEGYDNGSSK